MASVAAIPEVEPVLRTLVTPLNFGGCEGPRAPFPMCAAAVVLALVIALTILIVVVLARRARGCSWKTGRRGGFAPCCV